MSSNDQLKIQEPVETEQASAGEMPAQFAKAATAKPSTLKATPRKSRKQVINDLDAKARRIRERRSQLIGQNKSDDKKLMTKQAIVVGSWLCANRPEDWNEIVSGLTRTQDRKAFGFDPLSATPADPAAGGEQHTF